MPVWHGTMSFQATYDALCVELQRKGLQVVAVMSNMETTNVILLYRMPFSSS